jgi:hypothetical protein
MDGVDWDKTLKYMKEHPEDFGFGNFMHPKPSKEDVKAWLAGVKDITEIGVVMGYYSMQDKGIETGEWHAQSGVGYFLMPKGGRILAHMQHSSHVANVDCTDVRDLTHVEVEARRQNVIAYNFFRNHVPGFENAYITRLCPEARIREGRRIMGDYKIVPADILENRKFDDVIGKSPFGTGGKHAIGHAPVTRLPTAGEPKDGGSHDIPYRALVPIGLENMLVIGKAISADYECYHRYLMESIVTGQAGGVAGAVAAKRGVSVRDLEKDLKEVQDILVKQGAILYGTH